VSGRIQSVLFAAHYAAEKHATQKRKGEAAEPYINHLLEVALLVSSVSDDEDTVVAALLHDVIEDAGVTWEQLAGRFGSRVANLVAEVTDDKSLPKAERKRLQIENAPKKSIQAQTIKLADKISNLRSMISSPPADWDLARRQEYVAWAKQVVGGLKSPDPVLMVEFEKAVEHFEQTVSSTVS
jgi:(p)ppGpp synthase/HD superfamily hydrolase